MKTTNKQVVREVPWGMLVWKLPTGEFLGDDDGNFMHVFCTDLDQYVLERSKQALAAAAKSYGFEEGEPVFWAGVRPVDDEEYERQLARRDMGLTPDPLDIGAIRDEMRALNDRNR